MKNASFASSTYSLPLLVTAAARKPNGNEDSLSGDMLRDDTEPPATADADILIDDSDAETPDGGDVLIDDDDDQP